MREASDKSGTPLLLITASAAALGLPSKQVGSGILKFPGGVEKIRLLCVPERVLWVFRQDPDTNYVLSMERKQIKCVQNNLH